MNWPLESAIGLRYVRAGRGRGFVSFISVISMVGVAIGVAVLIVVLSVVNGFERELTQRLLAMSSHATIEGLDGRLTAWPARRAAALEDERVTAGAPYAEARALLAGESAVTGIVVRGVLPDEEAAVARLDVLAPDGSIDRLAPRAYDMVLGETLAEALDVGVGDSVVLLIAEGTVTPAGVVPRTRRFRVAGTFRAGMHEFDRRYAFVHLADAQRLLRLGEDVSGLRLALTDLFGARAIARDIALAQGGGLMISDWTRRHQAFFRSIQVTKSILFVILLLVIAVAAFNIVSTLVMVVRNKRADIAILRTLGASRRSVLGIFFSQGSLIGVLGALSGVALGVAVALNLEALAALVERTFGVTLLAADVYFISDLPSDVRAGDVGIVVGVALALVFAATIYPAWRAARTNPAEELRFD